jgi:hypothetical protein
MKAKLWFLLIFVAALLPAQELPRLAVVEFTINDSSNIKLMRDRIAIRNQVQSNIVRTAKYEVIARDEIDKLLENQQIQVSSIASQENIRKLQLQNIQYLITGTVDALDEDYVVSISILDVSNGRFTHSTSEFMGSGSAEVYNGTAALVTSFMAGLSSDGQTVVSTAVQRPVDPSTTTTGIRVITGIAGTLYFQGEETATLWDNDEYIIPLERPGTYTVKMLFGNGQESSRTLVIQSRGIVEAKFAMQPFVQNLRAGEAGYTSVPLSWNDAGTGLSYRVYYNTENNPQTARITSASGPATTVTSLNPGTDYYFWISAITGTTEGEKSPALSVRTPSYTVGTRGPAGGLIFYDKGEFSEGWRYLEAAPNNLNSAQWGAYERNVSGTSTDIGTGKRNTEIIVAYLRQIGETGRAAQLCDSFVAGGYDDWFLPSTDELNLMYQNLKQRGLGGFTDSWYWSSSQHDSSGGSWHQNFGHGDLVVDYRVNPNSVRCIRAF